MAKIPRKPAKKSEYQKQRDIWYKKLEESGFEDAERLDGTLKSWSSKFCRFANKTSIDTWEAKAAYYRMSESFLTNHKFETELDRVIWEYHANALSVRDIATTLGKIGIKTNKDAVLAVVKRLEAVMKKTYLSDG